MPLIPSAAYQMAVEVPSMYCNRKMASAAISSNQQWRISLLPYLPGVSPVAFGNRKEQDIKLEVNKECEQQ
jgi:hypothetical protein